MENDSKPTDAPAEATIAAAASTEAPAAAESSAIANGTPAASTEESAASTVPPAVSNEESAASTESPAETAKTTAPPISWQSGDWQANPNTSSPFNGLDVQAVPVYGNTGTVETITTTITDYTLIKEGAPIALIFALSDIMNEMEKPLRPVQESATLDGFMKFRLLQSAPDKANLFVSLTYGPVAPSNKNVQGCILQVPLILS
ncbi:MAG: hypothetical protein ACXV9R_08155 [Methylobacter sp.]